MNKLLKSFTNQDLIRLVRENMYDDLAPVHGLDNTYVSESFEVVVHINAYKKHSDILNQSAHGYNRLMKWADAANREPLYIFSTPLGIWEFNLSLITPRQQSFDEISLHIDKGMPVMPWYPEYNSEDEWIDSAMEEIAETRYSDPAEMDLEGMMEELLNYDGNLEDYYEPNND